MRAHTAWNAWAFGISGRLYERGVRLVLVSSYEQGLQDPILFHAACQRRFVSRHNQQARHVSSWCTTSVIKDHGVGDAMSAGND